MSASQTRFGVAVKLRAIKFGAIGQAMLAVGGANTARRSHDGADVMPVHQAFDPPTAGVVSGSQHGMDPRAAVNWPLS